MAIPISSIMRCSRSGEQRGREHSRLEQSVYGVLGAQPRVHCSAVHARPSVLHGCTRGEIRCEMRSGSSYPSGSTALTAVTAGHPRTDQPALTESRVRDLKSEHSVMMCLSICMSE